ncbi:MAG: 3'-5' exonuclease [Flavisolibacter sp.]
MFLFFDTETTGLPRNWKAPVSDLANWPRLVQLAWLLFDEKGQMVRSRNVIIKPQNFAIPQASSRIHGITTERALTEGVDLLPVLQQFDEMIQESSCLVAHNMSFDEKIVGAEFLRSGMSNSVAGKKKICTMQATTDFCALHGPYGYKWPRLSELHYKLFRSNFDEAHNAAVDITITAKCFWELKRQGVLARELA